jgi:hypothetical protein
MRSLVSATSFSIGLTWLLFPGASAGSKNYLICHVNRYRRAESKSVFVRP